MALRQSGYRHCNSENRPPGKLDVARIIRLRGHHPETSISRNVTGTRELNLSMIEEVEEFRSEFRTESFEEFCSIEQRSRLEDNGQSIQVAEGPAIRRSSRSGEIPLDFLNERIIANALIEPDGWRFAGSGRLVGSSSDFVIIAFKTAGCDCAQ